MPIALVLLLLMGRWNSFQCAGRHERTSVSLEKKTQERAQPLPDTLLASFARSGIGNETATYTFSAQEEIILPAHTTLWLVVKSSDFVFWYQSESAAQGSATLLPAMRKNGEAWAPTNGSFTIRIEGTAVPEPSASLMLAMGLGSALMWRRRFTC